jgi:CubicO group peptidase (beta-lactamase class C family)
MKFSCRVALFCVFVIAGNIAALSSEVDDYVRDQMARQHIPGLSLAVVTNGQVAKADGYGFANVESKAPATTETIYQIQSVTKTFTAAAVMLLVEEGKMKVEDKLSEYLTDLPGCWSEVTIHHLLTHTSGIKDFINEPTVNLRLDVQPEEVIKSLEKLPLNFAPGEKYAYCNTGYHLLGMVIYKLTGKRWGEFVQDRILKPLGMNNTRVIGLSEIITNRAAGYVWEDGKLWNGDFVAPTILAYAGGGLRSTVLDLAKWDAALYSEKLLKHDILKQMWTAPKLNNGSDSTYGYGWVLGEFRGHRTVSHTGSHMTGFKTVVFRLVDDKVTVIVLTNQRAAEQVAIAKGVAGFYIPSLRAETEKSGATDATTARASVR